MRIPLEIFYRHRIRFNWKKLQNKRVCPTFVRNGGNDAPINLH